MGIKVYDTGFGQIRRVVRYVWKCTGCGREYPPGTKRCPVCGAPIKPYSFVISDREATH